MHAVKIIGKPTIDFGNFLTTVFELTGRKISEAADATNKPISKDVKLAMCLADLIGQPPGALLPAIASQLHFSVLAMLDDIELPLVMQAAGQITWMGTETTKPGVLIGLMTGDLNEWRDAVVNGRSDEKTRQFYHDIAAEFQAAGYTRLWAGYEKKTTRDGLYMLEHRR